MNPTDRFSNRAAEYAAGRPDYPQAVIDALLADLGPPGSLEVADLGAGTGISSRALADRGCSVIAVEPNETMRRSGASARNVTAHAGTAERTGLPDAAFDLVTVFQAFHWFRFDEALHEMARIARPDGRAALVYNVRDDFDPATHAYSAIVRGYASDGGADARRRGDGLEHFVAFDGWSHVAHATFSNAQGLDRAGLLARAFSTSYLPKDGTQAEALRADLDAFFEKHERDGRVTIRMKTIATIATVR